MNALTDMPTVAISTDGIGENECDYRNEPFTFLLNNCLPFLSLQNLDLIADDIQEYVLSPDRDDGETDLFTRYPSAQFVLSEFRKVFRSVVSNYQEKELIVAGQPLNPCKQKLCVCEVIKRLTYLLYQRMTCYTAGLDIDLITALSATAYESKSPEGESIAILPSLKWLEKEAIALFEPLDSVTLVQPQLRALRKQLNVCGKGALAIYKDDTTGIYKTAGVITQCMMLSCLSEKNKKKTASTRRLLME